MFSSYKTEKKQQLIDVREAFNIWDVLNSKYLAVEHIKMWQNFSHDVDLQMQLKKISNDVKGNIQVLEKEMTKYAVKAPDQNRSFINSPGNSQVIGDEFIALETFLYLQEYIESLLKVFRSSVTNESLRNLIKKMAFKTIDHTDKFIKYLLLKGWINMPPLYKSLPEEVKTNLSTVEAANLWDHLTLRYDNVKTTEIFINVTHDVGFKGILQMGYICR